METLNYRTPPAAPTSSRPGKDIVLAVIAFMTFSWVSNLYFALARDELSVWQGFNFVVCLSLIIWLWRGAAWARWVTFAIYSFFGLLLLMFSVQSGSVYLGICAAVLCSLSVGLAIPTVGRFQRHQRRALA